MGNCAGKPKTEEPAKPFPVAKPTVPKVEESKPVPPKLKEEDDPNSPFFRGPRPDPPKPAPVKPATPEATKVTAVVHEAEVVDSKGCSAKLPDVPAPCSTCEVDDTSVPIEDEPQVQDQETDLPTRPSRVSFNQGEKSEDDAHPIERVSTPVGPADCPIRESQESQEEEPVREPTPKPETPEPVQEVTRSRTSSEASVSTCPSTKNDQDLADFVEATAAPAIETSRQEVANIEIEDVIEDDIIKPIHRQYSEKGAGDRVAGKTLEEYRSKIADDAGDVGDEIAKALEELESAQTALDNTKQESVMEETVSALQADLQSSFDLSLDNRKNIKSEILVEDADQDEIEEKLIPVKVTVPDEPVSREDAADEVANVLSRSLTMDDEDDMDIDVSNSRIDDLDEEELPACSPELDELDSTELLDMNRSPADSRPSEPTPSAYSTTPTDTQAFFPASPVEQTPSPEATTMDTVEKVQDTALEAMAAEIAAEALEIEKLGMEEQMLKAAEDEIKNLKVSDLPSDLPDLEDVSCEPGEIEYDYVKKDLEPGNDTLDLIQSNEKVLTKLDNTNPDDIVLSPVLSPAPETADRKSPDFGETENSVIDDIKNDFNELKNITQTATEIAKQRNEDDELL